MGGNDVAHAGVESLLAVQPHSTRPAALSAVLQLPGKINVAHIGLECLLAVLVVREPRNRRPFVSVLVDTWE